MKYLQMLPVMLLVAGCHWAPGHFLAEQQEPETAAASGYTVEFEKITPALVAENLRKVSELSVPAELLDYQPGSYRIGPTDVLYVTVWDHPELTTPSGTQQQIDANGRVVKPDGKLFFPYVGNVQAEGLTVEEFRDELARRLAVYIDDPQLDVSVLRYASQTIYLSGALRNSAPIKLTSTPLTLAEALGQAGVESEQADLSSVKLVRKGREYALDVYRLNRDTSYLNQIYLRDQDAIHVNYNDSKKVFIMGEVRNPTALNYRADRISLSEALATVGGLNQSSANGRSIYVIRGVSDQETAVAHVYQLDGRSPTGFILANRFPLEAQDIVYVGPTQVSRWARIVDEILPTFQMLNMQSGTAVNIRTID